MQLSNQCIRRPVRFELSMTGMIDVVFLLLIFFLVTTSFIRPEHRLRSGIKIEDRTTAVGRNDLEPAVIDIVGQGSEFVYRIGDVSTTDLRDIRKVLETFGNKDDGAFVRVVDGAPFDMPAKAINLCKQAGFDLVSLVPLNVEH